MKDAYRGMATDRQLVFFDDSADVAIDRRGMIRWVLPHRGSQRIDQGEISFEPVLPA
jgi:hypothetical protein